METGRKHIPEWLQELADHIHADANINELAEFMRDLKKGEINLDKWIRKLEL